MNEQELEVIKKQLFQARLKIERIARDLEDFKKRVEKVLCEKQKPPPE